MRYIEDVTNIITSVFGLGAGLRSMGEEEREGEVLSKGKKREH